MPQDVWKPTKAKDAQQCITLYTTINHCMLCYYFRHTTDFIGQNTRGRSPHASLDINTTSNDCPVSIARVAQLVERRTPMDQIPQISNFFLEFICWKYVQYNPKKPFKEKKKKKIQIECQFWKLQRPRTRSMNLQRSQ